MTICIVDDNALVGAQLRGLLIQAGISDTNTFTDAERALDWCLSEQPELILLDYNMPRLDGLGFLARLRREQATRHTPVAMISAWDVPSLRAAALKEGVVDVIAKPFRVEDVKERVSSILRRPSGQVGTPKPAQWPGSPEGQAVRADSERDAGVIDTIERLLALRGDRPLDSLVRMGRFAAAIGKVYGFDVRRHSLLARAAVLSEIGSLSRSTEDMTEGRVAQAEPSNLHQLQAIAGHLILTGHESAVLKLAAEISLTRYEHWDGSGIPNRLRGAAIPSSARLVAVADSFELMTCKACNNGHALPFESAARVIQAASGEQFDPTVVAAFTEAFPALLAIVKLPAREAPPRHRSWAEPSSS
jgi:response regulator RpfG family c-di-GMP phosphodiesterase